MKQQKKSVGKSRSQLIAEARAKRNSKYWTGKPCRNGHSSERWTSSGKCVECSKQKKRRAYKRRREAGIEISRNPPYALIEAIHDPEKRQALLERKASKREYHRKDMKKRAQINRNNKVSSYRLRKYGIVEKDFYDALAKQKRRCAICSKYFRSFSEIKIDHCHSSGKFRALLCNGCNRGIGFFGEDPEAMTRAALYVIHHSG